MPIEIRELVIRAVAEPGNGEGRQGPNCESAASLDRTAQSAVVEEAVREVLRILKASKER